jgi:hypothetical protein
MHAAHTATRSGIARAVELAPREAAPSPEPAHASVEPAADAPRAAELYVSAGEFPDERGWWAKQLGHH